MEHIEAINKQSFSERLKAYKRNPFSLFLAALGTGALCCFHRRRDIMTELAIGIAGCAVAGALLPPSLIQPLLLFPALAGILCNLEKFRRYWQIVAIFGILALIMLPNALLPPNSWDEQVYQIALLKQYAGSGFWNRIADNPYSAYPSLIHAFLLCAFKNYLNAVSFNLLSHTFSSFN